MDRQSRRRFVLEAESHFEEWKFNIIEIGLQIIMELKASKLLILDRQLQSPEDFQSILPREQLQKAIQKSSADLHELYTPIMAVLFGYLRTPNAAGLGIDMEIQLMIKGQKISYKQLKRVSIEGYLYRVLELNSCDCYEKPISLLTTIKYAEKEQFKQIGSVEELSKQLSKRQFGLYNEKTSLTARRQIIFKEPITAFFRYSCLGYIWMKFTNLRDTVVIKDVRLMTWLAEGNQKLKNHNSKSSLEESIKLEKGQSMALTLSCPTDLTNQQLQYWVEFTGEDPTQTFKLIKYIYIE